jgi:hypothetical protein
MTRQPGLKHLAIAIGLYSLKDGLPRRRGWHRAVGHVRHALLEVSASVAGDVASQFGVAPGRIAAIIVVHPETTAVGLEVCAIGAGKLNRCHVNS